MTADNLRDVQRAQGGVFADERAAAAAHFGDPAGEYRAAAGDVALFDLSDRTSIELRGADRLSFLNSFCTNDLARLGPGEGCEAFLTTIKGRILAHLLIFAAADALWLESVPGAEEAVISHLDRYLITEDVTLLPRTADLGPLLLSGPSAADRLRSLFRDESGSEADVPLRAQVSGTLGGIDVIVRRFDFTPQPGFELIGSRARLPALWTQITGSGVRAAGRDVFEALRIEAGFPLSGIDVSEENIAQEAGRTKQAISFTKGCYLGQEPIARLDALGHVNRELRGIALESGPVPAAGDVVRSADGADVGRITSSALSYAENRPVALAMLRSSVTEPGTGVSVAHASGEQVSGRVFAPR